MAYSVYTVSLYHTVLYCIILYQPSTFGHLVGVSLVAACLYCQPVACVESPGRVGILQWLHCGDDVHHEPWRLLPRPTWTG